jgi:hypothetical protein
MDRKAVLKKYGEPTLLKTDNDALKKNLAMYEKIGPGRFRS